MKTNETQMLEATKTVIQSAVVLVFCYSILFSHSATLMGIAGAVGFTISVSLHPHYFRSRRGSLTPAFCLLAFVWLCAAVTIVFSLLGTH
jgi:hypothetical protein